jgi:hypothetical protein
MKRTNENSFPALQTCNCVFFRQTLSALPFPFNLFKCLLPFPFDLFLCKFDLFCASSILFLCEFELFLCEFDLFLCSVRFIFVRVRITFVRFNFISRVTTFCHGVISKYYEYN